MYLHLSTKLNKPSKNSRQNLADILRYSLSIYDQNLKSKVH